MQQLIFLLILTLLLIKPTANAIFLSKVGVDSLPIAYLLVAATALVFTLFYNKYITQVSPLKIFYRSMQGSIVLLLLIGTVLWLDKSEIFGAYFFYLFISIFGILSASQFWILANQIFDAREARKYFGIIGFGAIAGGITGGYLASLISSFLQSEIIPFIAAAILMIVLRYLGKFSLSTTEKAEIPVPESIASNFKKPLKLILDSKHLSYIAIVIALSVFTSKLIDFQFGYFATQTYINEEDLTSFYGFMYSTFNLVAIAIQIFLTTRLIGRFGIGYSLLLLPILLVLNAGILILLPGLIVVSVLKLSDASMKQSINKAAVELIMLPVPKDIKLRTKTFLDVFIDSIATGFSGIVLIMVLQAFDLPNWIVTLLILCSAGLWLYLSNRIRTEYKKVFRKSLKIKSDISVIDAKNIEETYHKILTEGNDSQILKALNFLLNNPMPGLEQLYLSLLTSKNSLIVNAAIDVLTYIKNDYSKEIEALLNHKNQNVRISAFEYLINHQFSYDPKFLIERINSEDLDERIIALVAYAKEFKNDPRTLNTLRIEDRLQAIVTTLENENAFNASLWSGVLKAISYGKFSSLYYIIDKFLQSNDLTMRHHAMRAAGETQSTKYLSLLIDMLDTTHPEQIIISTLSKFQVKRINKVIDSSIKSNRLDVLRNISKVLELYPNQAAIYALQGLIEHEDLELRNNAVVSLRVLSDSYPLLQLDKALINRILIEECKYTNNILKVISLIGDQTNQNVISDSKPKELLITLLEKKIDENLQIIFELLHIKYPPENYIELYNYVKGSDTELRNNAIEYVDNSLTYDLKSAIVPLLEFISTPNDLSAFSNPNTNHERIKSFLINNRDEQIQKAARAFYH